MSRHAGLGTAGAAPNLPTLETVGGQRFSMFFTAVPQDLADVWLENLFMSAGPLVSMRRVRDANGVAKGFGFAEYGDLESVIRCLSCINGLRLPSSEGDKVLSVKADAKTTGSLQEYEATREDSDEHQEALQATQNAVRDVLQEINSSAPSASPASALAAAQQALEQGRTHLQDLGPDDLPEQSRGQITKEIAFFRDQAAKREQARKEQADRERQPSGPFGNQSPAPGVGRGPPSGPRGGGAFGPDAHGRGPPRGPQNGYQGQGAEPPSRPQRQWGQPQFQDPQSYSTGPTQSFVRGGGPQNQQAQEEREEADAFRQQERQQQRKEQHFRDRERQWEHRERQRAIHNDREAARDATLAKDEQAGANSMLRRLEKWDEEREARDSFYADRNRWRAQRRAFRARERDHDEQDAKREKEQLAEIQKQSDAFLSNQADMFASLSGTSRAPTSKGAVKEEEGTSGGPIKLADRTKAKPKTEALERKPKSGAFAAADDEEETGRQKRPLIPLDYSGLEQGEDAGLTEAQIADRRKKRVQELVASIPTEKPGLWSWTVDWAHLSQDMLQKKIKPFIGKKVADALGDDDEDVVNACMSHLESHKSAADLVEEIEPVLADEAEEFVIKIWRFLIFETLAAKNNVSTSAAAA